MCCCFAPVATGLGGTGWRWLALAGVGEFRAAGDLRFEHLQFSLQAAQDGMGVALGPASHVAHDVEAGRLCKVLPAIALPLPPYCFALTDRANSAALAFAGWIERCFEIGRSAQGE